MNQPINSDADPRDVEHLRLLAIFHFVAAGLALLGLCFTGVHFLLFKTFFTDPDFLAKAKSGAPPPEFWAIMKVAYVVFGVWFAGSGIGNLLSGIFMRARRHRTFSFIVAGFNCIHIPLGTVLGVFTFMVLGRDSVVRMYARSSAGTP